MKTMKKYFILLSAAFVSVALVSSCQKEIGKLQKPIEEPHNEEGVIPFELNANIAETKTTLNTSTYAVTWEASDVLYAVTTDAAWGDGTSSSDASGDNIATFTYSDGKFTTDKVIDAGSHTFNFIYEGSNQKKYHRATGTTHQLSATQDVDAENPAQNLKANDALVGQITKTIPASLTDITMSHIYTLMKVTLKNKLGAAVTATKFEIQIEGEDIAGIFDVAFDTPGVSIKSGGKDKITVNITNGAIADEGTIDVYFVMAPVTNFTGNVTFTVTDSNENIYTRTNAVAGLTFAAGTYNTANFSLKPASYPTIDTSSSDYTTGFETDFTAESTYNNTTVKVDGPDGGEWGSYYGTASTNDKISGSNSMQMRWYTGSSSSLGYVESNFFLSNVGFVSFNAKQTNGLKVGLYYKRASDGDWVLAQTFAPETTSTKCSYAFNTPIENARIKFGVVLPAKAPTGTSKLWIDDVVVKRVAPSYTVTIDGGISHGTVSTSPSGSVLEGAEVTITATPEDGYALTSLSVTDALSQAVTVTANKFTMPGSNVTVTATFAKLYAVTWSAPSNGTITVKHGETILSSGNTVPEGATVTITTDPDDGYKLSALKYNDGPDHDIKASKTFTMPAHAISITAEFDVDSGTTASVTIGDYATANSWSNGSQHTSIPIDANITASASSSGNNGKYYTAGKDWRFYRSDSGTLTISASNGKKITSITITCTFANSGKLTYGSDSSITSGTAIPFDNVSSVVFTVGNTNSSTNGQCKITEISVTYEQTMLRLKGSAATPKWIAAFL